MEIGIQIRSVEDSIKKLVDRKAVVQALFERQVERRDSCSDNIYAPLTIIESCKLGIAGQNNQLTLRLSPWEISRTFTLVKLLLDGPSRDIKHLIAFKPKIG